MGETSEGSRSEVRGFRNFELRFAPFSHVTRHGLVALADFFSILLASIAQLEHQNRPRQKQRDGIGQNNRPGMEDQSIQKPKADAGREYGQHAQRYIARRFRGPRLLQLGPESTGGERPCRKP